MTTTTTNWTTTNNNLSEMEISISIADVNIHHFIHLQYQVVSIVQIAIVQIDRTDSRSCEIGHRLWNDNDDNTIIPNNQQPTTKKNVDANSQFTCTQTHNDDNQQLRQQQHVNKYKVNNNKLNTINNNKLVAFRGQVGVLYMLSLDYHIIFKAKTKWDDRTLFKHRSVMWS